MEPIRHRPQDITPGRPAPGRPTMPAGHRAVFSDFTTRPQTRPTSVTPRPATALTPSPTQTAPLLPHTPGQINPAQHHPQQATLQPIAQPIQPRPAVQPTNISQPPAHTIAAAQTLRHMPTSTPELTTQAPGIDAGAATGSLHEQPEQRPFATSPKTLEHHSRTSRAGLIGFVCFVVLTALLLSPFLPSKTFDSFPGSSQSSSTGDDSLACIHDLQQTSTTTSYNHKLGSPITYSYATTTTQKAVCDNKPLTAIAGHTGQFNPLGLVIDLALAGTLGFAVAKIWRWISSKRS